MTTSTVPNKLINETSPYLLQHAYNPVDWLPWAEDAFDRAKKEDKPIFLSIGYSACHWCHVMEQECFEDNEVAEILNRSFISVKVDREERPDVDHFYMQACGVMTGGGGWPLSAFLNWDKKPFFTGTYFPKNNMRGGLGFLDLLRRIEKLWAEERRHLTQTAESVFPALAEVFEEGEESGLSYDLGHKTAMEILETLDEKYGGFGRAPKFPAPHTLLFLMRSARNEPLDSPTWQAVSKTLEGMARGGLRDHIGGGFCRYSTDAKWLVPHFEKMIYDNALLMMAYTERFEKGRDSQGEYDSFGDECFQIVRETAEYVFREMTDVKTGLFYTSQDADSEGVEGKYYTFTPEEIETVLGKDALRFCQVFDIRPGGHLEGRGIPNMIKSPNVGLFDPTLVEMRNTLFRYRESRVPPCRDEKALLQSNGLMIAALSKAARVFENEEYRKVAARAAQYILLHMRALEENRLFTVWKDGRAGKPATLDGYAYFIWALIELYQTDFSQTWLQEAENLTQSALQLFEGENGGLYYTGMDISDLPRRGINAEDGATPSGQSVMAFNLIRLSRILHREEWENRAQSLIGSLSGQGSRYPRAFTFLLCANDYLTNGGVDITFSRGEGIEELLTEPSGYYPYMTVCYAPDGHIPQNHTSINVKPVEGRAAAYVCQKKTCYPPVTSAKELSELLRKTEVEYAE